MRPSLVFFLLASMISLGSGSEDQLLILDPWKWNGVAEYLSYFIRWVANESDRSFMPTPNIYLSIDSGCGYGTLGPLNMTERAADVTVCSSYGTKETELIVTLQIPNLAFKQFCSYRNSEGNFIGDVLSHAIILNITVPLYTSNLTISDKCKLNNVQTIMSPLNFKLPNGGDNSFIGHVRKFAPFYQGPLMKSVSMFVEKLTVDAMKRAQLCTYLKNFV